MVVVERWPLWGDWRVIWCNMVNVIFDSGESNTNGHCAYFTVLYLIMVMQRYYDNNNDLIILYRC